jgi:hypothetical protein
VEDWDKMAAAVLIAAVCHALSKRYLRTSVIAAAVAALAIVLVIYPVQTGEMSNIFPIAIVFWLVITTPIAFAAGLPFLLWRRSRDGKPT